MSFYEQERALFDLLFDAPLRQQFREQGVSALSNYGLSDNEREDFKSVRLDALEMDAAMRVNLIVSQFCRSFPLSFSLLSAKRDGIAAMRALITANLMQGNPAERPVLFGYGLLDLVDADDYLDKQSFIAAKAIVNAETQMALISAKEKFKFLHGGSQSTELKPAAENWQTLKLYLEDNVAAIELPKSYTVLKNALCPVTGSALWARLKKMPLPQSVRDEVLADRSECLLLAKAISRKDSICDPEVHLATAELSGGFIPIFRYIDGSMSANEVLHHLQQAGAGRDLLEGLQKQLYSLLHTGYLTLKT